MQQTVIGPLDVASTAQFIQRIEEGDGNFTAPEARADPRVLWVNPDTGLRVALAGWASNAVDTSTPSILSRMAPETTDLSDYIGAAWIAEIQ